MIEWEIEDALQQRDCFVNGINGRPAHSDSYLTVLDYKQLDKVFPELPYTKEQWEAAIAYWLDNPNVGPPLKLAAKAIQRKLQKV